MSELLKGGDRIQVDITVEGGYQFDIPDGPGEMGKAEAERMIAAEIHRSFLGSLHPDSDFPWVDVTVSIGVIGVTT